MPLYPMGPESEDLVQALRNSDPLLRARAARALAACRGYLALPDLLVAARSDADGVPPPARYAGGYTLRHGLHGTVRGRSMGLARPSDGCHVDS